MFNNIKKEITYILSDTNCAILSTYSIATQRNQFFFFLREITFRNSSLRCPLPLFIIFKS